MFGGTTFAAVHDHCPASRHACHTRMDKDHHGSCMLIGHYESAISRQCIPPDIFANSLESSDHVQWRLSARHPPKRRALGSLTPPYGIPSLPSPQKAYNNNNDNNNNKYTHMACAMWDMAWLLWHSLPRGSPACLGLKAARLAQGALLFPQLQVMTERIDQHNAPQPWLLLVLRQGRVEMAMAESSLPFENSGWRFSTKVKNPLLKSYTPLIHRIDGESGVQSRAASQLPATRVAPKAMCFVDVAGLRWMNLRTGQSFSKCAQCQDVLPAHRGDRPKNGGACASAWGHDFACMSSESQVTLRWPSSASECRGACELGAVAMSPSSVSLAPAESHSKPGQAKVSRGPYIRICAFVIFCLVFWADPCNSRLLLWMARNPR